MGFSFGGVGFDCRDECDSSLRVRNFGEIYYNQFNAAWLM